MNKIVIFDLDGTLIDSIQDITDAMNKMLISNGFKAVSERQMKLNLGGSSREIVSLSIGEQISEERLTKCEREYTGYYIDAKSPKTRPFDGLREVLSELKARGYNLVALSNKPDYEIEPIFERVIAPLGLDMTVGLSDKVEPKPNPNGALNILKKFAVEKENAYFVGDGETDVMTAQNAGIECIAVLWGNRDRAFLEKFGAKNFAENPKQLLDLIK